MGERNWFLEERRNTQRDGEYSFSDELMGNEETFATSPVPKLLGTLKRDWSPSYQGAYGDVKKDEEAWNWWTQLIQNIQLFSILKFACRGFENINFEGFLL